VRSAQKAPHTWALGAPAGWIGWPLWWGVRDGAATLLGLPADASLELATVAAEHDEDQDPAVGRAFFGGPVHEGSWCIANVSPALEADTVKAALEFVRELVENGPITVRDPAERAAFDAAAEVCVFWDDVLTWDGDTARLIEPDERTLLMLAEPVFRTRFSGLWRCDPIDDDED
jgi:hypothetical protein